MKVALVVLALVAAAAADAYMKPAYKPTYAVAPAYKEYSAPAHYKFDWAVKDDYYNDFGQYEARDGDNTKGNYWVVLPDGRRQNVNYHVDGYSGYVADVSYDGYAKAYEPSYKPAYKPAYSAPAYKPSYSAPAYKPSYSAPAYKPAY